MDEMQDMHDEIRVGEERDSAHMRRVPKRRPSMVSMMFDSVLDSFADNLRIVQREFGLFFGTTLALVGLLGFSSDKFCDGNTADYLSCTRPSTYYFYDTLHIILIVVGITFVLLWLLKRRSGSHG